MEHSIRQKGMKKIAVGVVAGAAVILFMSWLKSKGITPSSLAMIVLGAPAAIGLVGLLEVAMNRPFSEMEDWWGALKGWQRGVLGLLVAIIAFAIIAGGVVIALTL